MREKIYQSRQRLKTRVRAREWDHWLQEFRKRRDMRAELKRLDFVLMFDVMRRMWGMP